MHATVDPLSARAIAIPTTIVSITTTLANESAGQRMQLTRSADAGERS